MAPFFTSTYSLLKFSNFNYTKHKHYLLNIFMLQTIITNNKNYNLSKMIKDQKNTPDKN